MRFYRASMELKSRELRFIVGAVIGFSIEAISSLGSPFLASTLYRVFGFAINVDPFLLLYPITAVVLLGSYLCLAKRAYALTVGMAVGFILAIPVLMLAVYGA